ncbi:MAG: CDP-2,3-bis-(O-geranylgeranyl)-sn-glycerol synthase [Thermoplasmata archaeon]|nr:MAG: CDP-2,3-bis-(O-geranylgeranyl)-sn-glycerol synthase [Thermoplasmata archaeon]
MTEQAFIEGLIVIGTAFWITIPAYLPNSCAVIFGGGTPMDFGKSMKDGRRILGKGKTWRGFFGGALAGIGIGLLQLTIAFNFDPDNLWGFGSFSDALFIIALLAFGAMLGDALGSFIKRRRGQKPGAPSPGLDQYDFLIGAWLLVIIFQTHWFYSNFVEGIHIVGLIAILIITPLLHKAVNIIGYKTGKKDVPW